MPSQSQEISAISLPFFGSTDSLLATLCLECLWSQVWSWVSSTPTKRKRNHCGFRRNSKPSSEHVKIYRFWYTVSNLDTHLEFNFFMFKCWCIIFCIPIYSSCHNIVNLLSLCIRSWTLVMISVDIQKFQRILCYPKISKLPTNSCNRTNRFTIMFSELLLSLLRPFAIIN